MGIEVMAAAEALEAAESKEIASAAIETKDADLLPKEIGGVDDANALPKEIGAFESKEEITNSAKNDVEHTKGDSYVEKGYNRELTEKQGGSYRDVKKTSDGETHEVHHMPADSASNLERDDGPAIKMEKDDHRQTSSCGSSREAREYREKQKELIEQGKFREALQMDIDDIHDKFGDKYDEAIAEMMEYVNQLEQEGKLNG